MYGGKGLPSPGRHAWEQTESGRAGVTAPLPSHEPHRGFLDERTPVDGWSVPYKQNLPEQFRRTRETIPVPLACPSLFESCVLLLPLLSPTLDV